MGKLCLHVVRLCSVMLVWSMVIMSLIPGASAAVANGSRTVLDHSTRPIYPGSPAVNRTRLKKAYHQPTLSFEPAGILNGAGPEFIARANGYLATFTSDGAVISLDGSD